MKDSKKSLDKALIFVFTLSFLFVIGTVFYRYIYTKNYDYLIEASCDPLVENCFFRDCTNTDDCPPNELSIYKQWTIKAYDFPKCADNSCKSECESGQIACISIPCGDSKDDDCSTNLE